MPGQRRFRPITVTAACATAAAAVLWGIAISGDLGHLHTPLLVDDRAGAVMASTATVILWCFRWLAGFIATCGMAYLLDVMLSQRGWYRKRLGVTGPLRVRAPRHAR